MSEEEGGKSCDCCQHSAACIYCWDDSGNKFPPIRTFFLIGSFLFYIADVGLDVWVAYEHYLSAQNGDEASNYYFQATLFFIIVPILMINFLSWGLYAWGWMTFRISKVKNYCSVHAIPMHTFHVINWPWYHRSKSVKQNRNKEDSADIELHMISQRECLNEDDVRNVSVDGGPSSPQHAYPQLSYKKHSRKDSQSTPILEDTDTGLEFYPLDFLFTSEFVAVSILHILQLGYVFRVIRLLFKRKQDKYSFDRYRDLSFLRLMEAFLESAPQFVLQLYIATVKEETRLVYNIVTPLSLAASVCSLALAVGDYVSAAKDLNYYDPPPNHERNLRLSWTGYFIIIFWHLFMISGRGITLALFTSIYGRYLFLLIGIHYFVMVYWMYWQNSAVFVSSSEHYYLSHSHRNRRDSEARRNNQPIDKRSLRSCLDPRNSICRNYGIEFIIAAFNLFFHFKIKEGSSIQTLIPFYVITFVENTLMISLWYFSQDFELKPWYSEVAIVVVFVTFALGVVLVTVYYLWFQPSKQAAVKREPDLEHPTMTCSLNRLYSDKLRKENFFKQLYRHIMNK